MTTQVARAALLHTEGLTVRFETRAGTVEALSDVDIAVHPGEIHTVIGESGSGKSVLAQSLLGLLPRNASITGSARLAGENLLTASTRRLRQIRQNNLAFIPQSPAAALNPVRKIRRALTESAAVKGIPKTSRGQRLEDVTRSSQLEYQEVAEKYPHELSGGMQQRVMNSMALLGAPDLILADEPTTGLDRDRLDAVSSQLRALVSSGAGMLVITHDLDLVAALGGRTTVLYAGRVVEERATPALLASPQHPYSRALLGALPEHGLVPIDGQPPEMTEQPPGCPFAPRCPLAHSSCYAAFPTSTTLDDGRVYCHAAS